MATIKDVAKLAGVSTSTVSRAISGNTPVDQETKLRVMESVKALNYEPNALAKGLKEGKTNSIALIIPNIRNYLFPSVARGVEDYARKCGFSVILCNTDEDLEVEKKYLLKMKKRFVDGFIFATAGEESNHIVELKKSGVPVVLLVRHIQEEIDAVIINNFKSAYNAVSYLIDRGNKKIAIINGSEKLALYRDRFNGYKKALEDNNLVIDERLISKYSSETSNGYEAMNNMLNNGVKPDAVFATNDAMALAAMRAIKDFGLKIPEDISIIGFDNLEFTPLFDPPLSTVAQPLYEMGEMAAKKLISIIKRKRNFKPVVDVIETELIIRKSTK
jgi:LacI family transcriptional regulator